MQTETEIKESNFIDLGFVQRVTDLPLTNREKEVLTHVAQGRTNKQISKLLELSPSTIRNHISNIFTKLRISNRAQATAIAIYSGLLNSSTFKNDWEAELTK